ncbi:hypothetical protein HEQ63_10485 [Haematospirillum jordaniae]|uniref:hypothetical protein n=1 Tax=Haematospirillum jordaniae TaxID=1549855 RepID=UPI0014330B55|nr:hypothetical protein [Haematospirillum jordaniae]NKD86608.1 hypothetical protein [Haematospirillum jordaniae]
MSSTRITITDAGRRAIINATGTNPVKITRAALGSEQYTPDPSQTRVPRGFKPSIHRSG